MDNRSFQTLNHLFFALWRLGLGWLIGRRLLLLTTVGRRSGEPHRVVVGFQFRAGTFYVISAAGSGTDWYRNLMARPPATIQAWPGPRSVRARRLSEPAELAAMYRIWRERVPGTMARFLESAGVDDREQAVRESGRRLHWVALEPTGQKTPEMTPPDLIWVWPAAVLAALLYRVLRRRRVGRTEA